MASGTGAVDKSNRYDRQIRLWGDHGQTALEAAKVCLINATATGTEILKNLVLPGIGSFTIVDGSKISGEDIGNNFFLTKDSIGKSRAQVATELLMELNEDVSGDFVEEPPDRLLESNPEFFHSFTIVIATNLHEKLLLQLAALLWNAEIPLLVCRCYGFIGYMRLAIRQHTVIESHPDNTHEDLRLDRPFTGLINFCDSVNLSGLSKKDHSHIPWLVILYKYLQKWRDEHEGEMPKIYREKNQLKEITRNGILKNHDGIPEEEENFEEAIKNINTALIQTAVPMEVKELFEDPACTELTTESKPFWIMLRAVKDFLENEGDGALPLRGSIPDMTADSERYIQLQNVYREQAAEDVASVMQRVQDLQQTIGKEEPVFVPNPVSPARSSTYCNISEQDVKLFCRNAAFLRVVRCRSLALEFDASTARIQELALHLGDEDDSDAVFYVLLRAVGRFYEEYSRFPGWYNDQVEGDVPKLKARVGKLLQEWGLSSTLIKDDYIHEMCRYGAAELHSLSAFMGGTVAQEAIKVITGQFVPLNNTFIYNAMRQTSITVEL